MIEITNQSKSKPIIMRSLYLIVLLFTGLSGFAVVPPVIQDPTPLEVCDPNNDGFQQFDLAVKIPEILGALNPSLYTVTFYETPLDAEVGANPLTAINTYSNINPITQDIYVRVQDNVDNTSYNIATLQLIVTAAPSAGVPIDLVIINPDNLGYSAPFDLTDNYNLLLDGQIGVSLQFYTSLADAQANANAIPSISVMSYVANTGTRLWARLENMSSGCFVIKTFGLYVVHANDVLIPDANFKAKLIQLGVDTNADGEIQQSEALAVTSLDVSNSNIADLTGFEYFLNVNTLNCSNNQLTALNLDNFSQFISLDCSNNQITSLNLDNIGFTMFFKATANSLTSLSMNNTTAFQFYCDQNNLQTLDLTTASIAQMSCGNNQLTELLMSSSSVSFELACPNNLLTSLPVSSTIQNLWCGNNLFTTLDFSNWTSLNILSVNLMPSLTSLYVKNGRNENVNFDSNSNLEFICADEGQLTTLQVMASGQDIIISTYCSFTPGGDYNTATGIVRNDYDTNGCDSSDIPMSFLGLGISLDTLPVGSSIYTNNTGNYSLYMSQAGTYTLNPILENPDYFTVSPTTIDATTINNTTTVNDICILPNGVHPDVEIVIAPISRARPGFEALYEVVIKNKGNQTLAGDVSFTYDDSVVSFVSSDVTPASQSGGLLNYNYTNLLPFQNKSFYITLHVNAPTDTPAVNIGDVLTFNATVNPIDGDENVSDNSFQFRQTVVGSFDPNDITCIEGNMVSPSEIGNYLHYVINFENTGTADAENIVVKELINTEQFDINSLQILNSSAVMSTKVTGNMAEFIFQNINLHSGGHGNILLKIKSRNTLVEGDSVSKMANIYFDYNLPVETPQENTIFQSLSNPDVEVDASIMVYPNPTKGSININCNSTIKSVELYDIQGRLLQTDLVNNNQTSIDISTQSKGVYFLKIISDKGMGVQKIVRE